jgi:AcrR family transcriptional regulator
MARAGADGVAAASRGGSRRLGRPPAVRSGETRDRIITVAQAQFARTGYASTSNKAIAREADLTTGSIYHYFPSKRALYGAVFEQVELEVFDRFAAVVASVDGGFLDKMAAVLAESVAIHREQPSLTDFFVAVPFEAQRTADLEGLDRRQAIDSLHFFGPLVAEGARSGEIAADVDVRAMTNAVMALAAGLARLGSQARDPDVHDRTARLIERMLRGRLFTPVTDGGS